MMRAGLLVLLVMVGCSSPDVEPATDCGPNGECPAGFSCGEGGKCRQIGSVGSRSFTTTGALGTPRQAPAAALLGDGTVLVAGGWNATDGALSTAEIYDPATGTFRPTGSMSAAHLWAGYGRNWPVLPGGKVLAAGGLAAGGALLASAELYDPAARTWSPTGDLKLGVIAWAPVQLLDGSVLVVGGWDSTTGAPPNPGWTYLGNGTGEVQRYEPGAGTWSTTGSLAQTRLWGCNVRLPSGEVLAIGGWRHTTPPLPETNVERFATATWSTTGTVVMPCGLWSFLLPNGKVLLDTGLLLDPATVTTSPTTGFPAGWTPGFGQLANGDVLAFGGDRDGTHTSDAYIYQAAKNTWIKVGSLSAPRSNNAAVVLTKSGQVLIVGGLDDKGAPLATAELYHP